MNSPCQEFWNQRQAQRQFVLRRLEEALPGHERPDWTACRYTLEHVMPQHLTKEWMIELSSTVEEDATVAHQELVHLIGNITLTCDNSVLSDHPLSRKQEILQTSVLKMNRKIEAANGWNRQTISDRSSVLAKLAIDLWPGPLESTPVDDDESAKAVMGVLQFLPSGGWVSLDDLAELLECSIEAARGLLVASAVPGRERVLRSDGSIETDFPWVAGDVSAYKSSLVGAGVLDDSTMKHAPSGRRVSAEALGQLVGGS